MLLYIKYVCVINRRKLVVLSDIKRRKKTIEKEYKLTIIILISSDVIMASKITPETAVKFTKIMVALCFSMPLLKNATRFQVIRFKILRFLVCVHVILLLVPMIYTLFNNDYNLARITKLCCLVAAFIQIPWEISSFALQYDRLQVKNTKVIKN